MKWERLRALFGWRPDDAWVQGQGLDVTIEHMCGHRSAAFAFDPKTERTECLPCYQARMRAEG